MKTYQIFVTGVVVLTAALLLPSYERILAAFAAVAMIVVVVVGFLLHPRKEIFYLRPTVVLSDPDSETFIEHDRTAVRVETARLWLLFVPTFAAVAFLLSTSAKGSTWNFSILDFVAGASYPVILGIRVFQIAVVGAFSQRG